MDNLTEFVFHLLHERNLSNHTADGYRRDIQQFLQFTGKEDIKCESSDIYRFITFLRNKGLSVSSTNRKLSALKTYYKFLQRRGRINHNPAEIIESGKSEKRLPKPVDLEDINLLVHVVDNLRDMTIIELLYGAGVRRSELAKIRVSDINFYKESIRVIGKGNKEREIPLHKNLIKLISKLINQHNSEWLFPSRKNPDRHITPRQINWIIEKWVKVAGLSHKNITPHKFRHSFCTHLFENGAELKVIQDLAGHSSANTTQLYTKVSAARNREEYLKYHPRAQRA